MSIADHVQKVYVVHSPRLQDRRAQLAPALEKHGVEATWVEGFEPDQIGLGLFLRRLRKISLRRAEISAKRAAGLEVTPP